MHCKTKNKLAMPMPNLQNKPAMAKNNKVQLPWL